MRKAGLKSTHRVLITWGGATAYYAVQLAKHVFKAKTVAVMASAADEDQGKHWPTPVTVANAPWACNHTCNHTPRGYAVRGLGADEVWTGESEDDEFDIGIDCDNQVGGEGVRDRVLGFE